MLKDCCFTRDLKSHPSEIVLTDQSLDKQEIEILFRDNTKMPSGSDQGPLPKSGLSSSTAERLKIEFRFIKHLMRLVSAGSQNEAVDLFNKYYGLQLCMNKEKVCGNEGWCVHCSSLELLERKDDLNYLDDILTDNFKFIQQITFMVLGPKGTPYESNKYQIDIDIPDKYPKVPLECYLKQKICHINVE